MEYKFIKIIDGEEEFPFRYSICTLVSKPAEYREMVDSFLLAGFNTNFCEYLCIDNSKNNTYEAFKGINRFLRTAKGKYIIICHQDILLHDHQIDELELRMKEMDTVDSQWAILSNAGGINFKYLAANLTQKNGNQLLEKVLPLKAHSIDENFMLIKKEANIALSHDLNGFHMYGTDICLIAEILGFNSYIIKFNLTHKSDGSPDKSFDEARIDLMRKYRRAFRGRFMSTTITRFYLSGNWFGYHLINLRPILFLMRQYYKFFKPKAGYQPKI